MSRCHTRWQPAEEGWTGWLQASPFGAPTLGRVCSPSGVLPYTLGICISEARGRNCCNLCQTPWLKPVSKRKNPLFSQATCSAFQQSCLGPVSCVHGRSETGLETRSSVWKGWGGMKPASLLICHPRSFFPVARGLHFLRSITWQ